MKKIYLVLLVSLFASIVFAQNESLSLIQSSKDNGITLYYDSLTSSGLLEKNSHKIMFRLGECMAMLDNEVLLLTDAPYYEGGEVRISPKFLNTCKEHLDNKGSNINFKIGSILIDAGHGGKDPGAIGYYKKDGRNIKVQEKDVVLAVSKKLYESLKVNYPNKQIIMTRGQDKFLTLNERTDIANSVKLKENEAVLYVSVHANASLDKKAQGYEVWYLSPGYRRTVIEKKDADNDKTLFPILNSMMEEEYTNESILMSKFIMDGLKTQLGPSVVARGIKAEEWFVVRNAYMPSVLIEVGFVSNEKEAINLASDSYLQKLSLGIYNGVKAFVTHFESSGGFTTKK